jgi:uncharacterized Zn finger protein
MAWYGGGFEFPEYVSVGTRRARARAAAEKIARKQKRGLTPVGPIDGNKLVRTFWGKAWCDNLESYVDYANRLPRGRSYARHGAVIDLQIAAGKITALVSGTSTYEIGVTIRSLPPKSWTEIASECIGQIDSLVDLLRGKLSTQVMEIVTRKNGGLFPAPKQISFTCSCPDWAGMCKHVAATLYGVGVRLDQKPELLFELRGVDHADLVSGAAEAVPRLANGAKRRKVIKGADLSALFGIELESPTTEIGAAGADGAGDRSPVLTDTPKTRRAKSAKRADSVAASSEPDARSRGTRRAQGKPAKRKRR